MTHTSDDQPALGTAPMFGDLALEYVATARADLGPIETVGPVFAGLRRMITITGGEFRGPLLNAAIQSGGADWQILAEDGTAQIDTRYSAVTDSGHLVLISTRGFRHGPPEVMARLAAGEPVGHDEYTFRVTATLECAAPELEWVNRTVFVAKAARHNLQVVYDLYAVR